MTRQLFAFLALLSGLAALSGTANASGFESLTCDVGVSSESGSEAGGVPAKILTATAANTVKPAVAASGFAPNDAQAALVRVPVLMGVERAYE